MRRPGKYARSRSSRTKWFGGAVIGVLLVAGASGSLGGCDIATPSPLVGLGSAEVNVPEASHVRVVAPQVAPRAPAHDPKSTFSIAGSVAGLYPGRTLQMPLTVENPKPFAIVVTSISTTVSSSSVTCAASNVAVAAFSGNLLVPGNRTAQTHVTVSMAHGAPNACQGVFFPFHYLGAARKA